MPTNILGPKDVDLSTPAQDNRLSPLNDFPLKEIPFRSRATWGFATGRNIKFIMFANHRALQASELNELQEHHVSTHSLQLRFNANWKNSSYGVIPCWSGIMPIDPNNVVVYEPEVIDSSTVKLKFFLSRGWYLIRRKALDKLNRWIYIPDDINAEFNYTNANQTYEMFLGFQFHSFVSKCCNIVNCTQDPLNWQELFSKEYRDNSQDYTSEAQNENTCGADRNNIGIVEDEDWTLVQDTDQAIFGFSELNEGNSPETVTALFKLVRDGGEYEIRFANNLSIIKSGTSGLPSTRVLNSNGDNAGDFSITYGSWQTSGLSPEEGGIVNIVNEGGSVTFENGYAIISTKRAGVPAERSGQLESTNSRAELRIEGNYTAPFTSKKMILGYQKFDTRLKARVKVQSALKTHLFIVGMYRTHAIDYNDVVANPDYKYFYGPGVERIIGFVNTLVDNTPTWTCVVMDGCYGNHRGFTNPSYSSYELFPTGYSCLNEHLLEVYMNKEETYVQFKVDGVTVKTYQNPNGLLCKQPRPKDPINTPQRTLSVGCAVRDTANTPYNSPIEGVMKINEISATIRSIVPFDSLSYPQFWNS